jgi:hypothetical protein
MISNIQISPNYPDIRNLEPKYTDSGEKTYPELDVNAIRSESGISVFYYLCVDFFYLYLPAD